jgi:glycosyltransferase involved in cell wall biosynthesis
LGGQQPTASALQVIVAQMGARRNYAVPRMLHKHGALSRLYTDLCIKGPAARAAAAVLGGLELPVAGKLRRRTVEGIPTSKVFSAPFVNLRSALARSATQMERYALENELFGRQMMEWGTGGANVVYAMYANGLPFLRYAKEQGLKVAADVFIAPLSHKHVARERAAFPDWEDVAAEDELALELIETHTRHMLEVADLLLCPSAAVLDDLKTLAKECAPPIPALPRAIIVPYGASSAGTTTHRQQPSPIPGRILFAGGADLRKGIHYLAMAANSLQSSRQPFEFRVAGHVSERIRLHPAARGLTFLGHLSRERMREEYAKADVFVLPTIAEGSAAVVFEALTAGVPVVTTRRSGSVVTHGKEGFVVPERDAHALAAAIETIVQDRRLRAAMAEAATIAAGELGEDSWGARLVGALATLTTDADISSCPIERERLLGLGQSH